MSDDDPEIVDHTKLRPVYFENHQVVTLIAIIQKISTVDVNNFDEVLKLNKFA